MNALTNYQIIEAGGHPAFVVIPYDEFTQLEITRKPVENGYIPHEVVGLHAVEGMPLVKAWRKHLGLTQKKLAQKATMAQSALARIEAGKHEAREETLQKLAKAMNLALKQLTLEN